MKIWLIRFLVVVLVGIPFFLLLYGPIQKWGGVSVLWLAALGVIAALASGFGLYFLAGVCALLYATISSLFEWLKVVVRVKLKH